LAILGPDDQLVCYLGDNGAVCQRPGWPNGVDELEHPVRTADLRHGRFNSPHGLTVDADGNLYVAEWLIGGRLTKLTPTNAEAGT
jgi:sugar lactone lactonase YvrE